MKNFFTKNTVEASCWCLKCGKNTFHQVHGGRPGACLECLKKLDKSIAEDKAKVDTSLEQLDMFDSGIK